MHCYAFEHLTQGEKQTRLYIDVWQPINLTVPPSWILRVIPPTVAGWERGAREDGLVNPCPHGSTALRQSNHLCSLPSSRCTPDTSSAVEFASEWAGTKSNARAKSRRRGLHIRAPNAAPASSSHNLLQSRATTAILSDAARLRSCLIRVAKPFGGSVYTCVQVVFLTKWGTYILDWKTWRAQVRACLARDFPEGQNLQNTHLQCAGEVHVWPLQRNFPTSAMLAWMERKSCWEQVINISRLQSHSAPSVNYLAENSIFIPCPRQLT